MLACYCSTAFKDSINLDFCCQCVVYAAMVWYCIYGKYIDVAYVIGLVNAGHQMLIVARANRSSLFRELYPIKEVGDSQKTGWFDIF